MPRPSPARLTFAAAVALLIHAGCAVSEPVDAEEVAKHRATGTAGTNGSGSSAAGTAGVDISGASADTGQTGSAGTIGSAGTTGSGGGAKTNVTSGQAGNSGASGTGGVVSGQAGNGAGGDVNGGGAGGSTAGVGGNGGTTGSAGRGGSGVDAGSSPDGAAAATFTDVYTTILVTYCSGSNCHKPGTAGGIDFSSQAAAFDSIQPRVVAGNAAGSSFYQTVSSGSMPRGQAKLSAANLAKIKSWIDAGALDN